MLKTFKYKIPDSKGEFIIYEVNDFEFQNPIEVYKSIMIKKNIGFYKTIYPNIEKEFKKNNIQLNSKEKDILLDRLATKDWEKWYIKMFSINVQENYFKLLGGKRKTEQINLLKNISITGNELTSLILKASLDYNYSFSQYRTEHNQKNIDTKQLTNFTYLEKNGKILTSRNSELSDGQLKQAIEHRTVTIAKFIDNENEWHCFFTNYKSVKGKEKTYKDGQKHYHYISSSWGLTREYVLKQLQSRKYQLPSMPHLDIIDE